MIKVCYKNNGQYHFTTYEDGTHIKDIYEDCRGNRSTLVAVLKKNNITFYYSRVNYYDRKDIEEYMREEM